MLYNTATPDSVYIYDENGNELIGFYYVQMDCKPVPFARGEYGEVIIGEVGQGHSELQRDYCESIGKQFSIYGEGRFWMDKYVTAWGTNAHSERMIEGSRNFYKSLYKDLLDQQNFDIGDYIVLLEGRQDETITNYCEIMVARVRDFVQNGKLTEFTRFMSGGNKIDLSEPFKPTDGTPDMPRTRLDRERLWKYGWVAEGKKLNEANATHASPDCIYLKKKNGTDLMDLWFDDKKAKPIPFIIANGKAYIGEMCNNHPRMAYDLKRAGTPIPYDENEIRGRMFKNKYIILWKGYVMPEGAREMYKTVRNVLLKEGIDITDYIAVFEAGWEDVRMITVRDYLNGQHPIPYLEFFSNMKKKKKSVPTAPNGMSTQDFWRHYQMVGEGVEEHELHNPYGSPHGTPDEIYLPDRERKYGLGFRWNSSEDNPVAFIIADGKLFVGDSGEVHDDIRKKIRNSGGSNLRFRGDAGQIEGRIYDNKYISLWTYNDPEKIETQYACKEIIRMFSDRALKMKANAAFTGESDKIGNVANMTVIFEPEYGRVYAATLKDYAATGKAYPYLDFFYPEKSDYEDTIARKDWEKNQWRHYQMVGEQAMQIVKKLLKESYDRLEVATPDVIKLFNNSQSHEPIYMRWYGEGAYPFIAHGNKLYVGDEGQSHYDVEQNMEDDIYYEDEGIRGRIFDQDGYKIFMVWHFYMKPFERQTIEAYKHLLKLFKLTQNVDITDMLTFFSVQGKIFASTVRDFIAGKTPVGYERFFEEYENKTENPSAQNGMNPKDIWRHYQFVGEQIAKHILQEMKKRGGK